MSVQTRITDELTGYLGTNASLSYNLQSRPGSGLCGKALTVENIVDDKDTLPLFLWRRKARATFGEKIGHTVWWRIIIPGMRGGRDHFPHSGEARQSSPRQSCIINAPDKNIHNRRTACDENSPDLN